MLWGLGQLQPEVQTGARGETGQPRHRREASWEKPNSVPPPTPSGLLPRTPVQTSKPTPRSRPAG